VYGVLCEFSNGLKWMELILPALLLGPTLEAVFCLEHRGPCLAAIPRILELL
jgi:hypothetical protein